eukprot:6195211-Pleurochrysis_carterae.AAC.2
MSPVRHRKTRSLRTGTLQVPSTLSPSLSNSLVKCLAPSLSPARPSLSVLLAPPLPLARAVPPSRSFPHHRPHQIRQLHSEPTCALPALSSPPALSSVALRRECKLPSMVKQRRRRKRDRVEPFSQGFGLGADCKRSTRTHLRVDHQVRRDRDPQVTLATVQPACENGAK